jgi:hypothetical protein|tara:strand:- start:811 stop:996 length:186 start_codon:yes stop_codon:yes gene_type:complete
MIQNYLTKVKEGIDRQEKLATRRDNPNPGYLNGLHTAEFELNRVKNELAQKFYNRKGMVVQ